MKLPKVLVATTTYEGKHYAFHKWWKSIMGLRYPNFQIMIVDNTKDNGNYCNKLRRLTQGKARVVHAPRLSNTRDTLSYCQNVIRQHVLDNDYDYWMSIESDLEVPGDTIETLMRWYKPVVGGLYEIGFENKTGRRYCVFLKHDKGNKITGTRLISEKEHQELKQVKGLIKIHGCGIGCTLIRRDILSRFKFWTDERFDNKHSDVYFYMDLENNGIPVYVDTNVVCEHHNSDWGKVEDR
jgi:hypothetical protein